MKSQTAPMIDDYVIQALVNRNMQATVLSFPQDRERALTTADYSYYLQELHKSFKAQEAQCEVLELTRSAEALEGLALYCQNHSEPFFKKLKLTLRDPQDPHFVTNLVKTLKSLDSPLAALQMAYQNATPLAQEKFEPLIQFVTDRKLCTEIELPLENAQIQETLDNLCSSHQREQRLASYGAVASTPDKHSPKAKKGQASEQETIIRRRKKVKNNVGIDIEVNVESATEKLAKEQVVEQQVEESGSDILDRREFVRRLKAKEFDLPAECYEELKGHEHRLWDLWFGNISQIVVSPDAESFTHEFPVSGPAQISRTFRDEKGKVTHSDQYWMNGFDDLEAEEKAKPVTHKINWQTREIEIKPDPKRSITLTIKYNPDVAYTQDADPTKRTLLAEKTVFAQRTVDIWENEYIYDASRYSEESEVEESLRQSCPKTFSFPTKVSRRLYENPSCAYMSSEAALHLLKHKEQLASGIDFQRLMAGFRLEEKEIKGEYRPFLNFDPKKAAKASPDLLAIKLEALPKAKALSYPLFKKWLDNNKNKLLAERFRELSRKGYHSHAVNLFKLYLPILVELSEAELRAVGPGIDNMVAAAKKAKTSLCKRVVDPRKHLFFQLLGATPLSTRIQEFSRKHHLSVNDLNGFLAVYDAYGEKGLEDLLKLLESARTPVFQSLQEHYFPVLPGFVSLIDEKTMDAINVINRFSPVEFQWWNQLFAQHCAQVGPDNLYHLVKAFQAFVTEIQHKKLDLYPDCQFNNTASLPVTLSRILTILNNTTAADLPFVWQEMTANNFQSNGAIRAVTDGGASIGAGQVVLPALDLRPENFKPTPDASWKNAPALRHGYHGTQITDLDPFRKLEYYGEGYRGKYPDPIESYQQQLAQAKTKEELERNFYRLVAEQEYRYPLGFYKQAAAYVEEIFADYKGLLLSYNNFDLRAAAYSIIIVATTGFDVVPHLNDSEAGLEQIKNILKSLTTLPFPTWMPKKLECFILEQLVRYGFLEELRPMPPLSYMNHFLTILKVGFSSNGSKSSDQGSLESNGRKYLKNFKEISDLVKFYHLAYYEGIRFCTEANSKETDLFRYSEYAKQKIQLRVIPGVSESALHPLKGSLVSLMSTFQLSSQVDAEGKMTDACLDAFHLDASAESVKRLPIFVCTLKLLNRIDKRIDLEGRELKHEDFLQFIEALIKRIEAMPAATQEQLSQSATALVRERFEAYFPEGYFNRLQAGELSEDLVKSIRKNFSSVDDQELVRKILATYPKIADKLSYSEALAALSRVHSKLRPADKELFLKTILTLNVGSETPISSLIELLASISERGKIDDFLFVMSKPEAKLVKPLLPKLQRFYTTVLPYLEEHRHPKLAVLELLPLSVRLFFTSTENEQVFKTHYQFMIAKLYATANHYNNETQDILRLLTNAVSSLSLSIPAEKHAETVAAFMGSFHDTLVEQDNPDLVRSLCDHYKDKPLELHNILGLLAADLDKGQRGVLLFMLSALLNNGRDGEYGKLSTFITLCKTNKALITLVKEFYHCPPYPDMDKMTEWHNQYHASPDYLEQMRAAYFAFNTKPCKREEANGFKIEEARHFASLFKGVEFTEEEFQNIFDQCQAVKAIASSELRNEYQNYKNLSHEEQQRQIPRYLAVIADLMHRAKGFEGDPGSSFELNTTQYMACYIFLKYGYRCHLTNQIDTGEGKSRIMMVANGAAIGKGMTGDFVTSDMELALRDFLEYQAYYRILGVETSLISATSPVHAYKLKGVNFSDASNLSLFRNRIKACGEIGAAIDPDPKARSLLLDEADRTEFDVSESRYNYSAATNDSIKNMDWIYDVMMRFFSKDDLIRHAEVTKLYHDNISACTDEFLSFLKAQPGDTSEMLNRVMALPASQLESWLESAYTASNLKLGVDYAIEPNVSVNTSRGTVMASEARLIYGFRNSENAKFSFGVHQCLHAYLNQQLQQPHSEVARLCQKRDLASNNPQGVIHPFAMHAEKQIVYSSTAKSFLDAYAEGELWAVTGTAGNVLEREEAALLYGKKGENAAPMKFITVPRNKTLLRNDHPLLLTADFEAKIAELKASIDKARAEGRPTIIFSENDKESDRIREVLEAYYPPSERTPALWQHVDSSTSSKDQKLAENRAGQPGCVSFATPRMGRGTDIKLSPAAKAAGGMNLLATFLPSWRDQIQIFGRGGRYGDKGDARIVATVQELEARFGKELPTEFYLSTEFYLRSEQERFDREKQMERLVRNALSDFRARITDGFFRYYDSLDAAAAKERREKTLLWADYTKKVDQLWNQVWPDIFAHLTKPKPDMHEITKRLHRFKLDAEGDWRELHSQLGADETVLPSKLADLQLDFRTEYLMRIMMPKRKYTLADKSTVFKTYDKAHDGRAVVYDELFADWKAIWRGDRVLFANTRAWWNGHGILFADTRAWWAGKRPLFANFRAWLNKTFNLTPEPPVEVLPDLVEVLEQHDQLALKKVTKKLDVVNFLSARKDDLTLSVRVELVEAILDFANTKMEKKEEVSNAEMDLMLSLLRVARDQDGDTKSLVTTAASQLQHSSVRFFGPSMKRNLGPILQRRFDEYCKDDQYLRAQDVNGRLQVGAKPVLESEQELEIPALIKGAASAA